MDSTKSVDYSIFLITTIYEILSARVEELSESFIEFLLLEFLWYLENEYFKNSLMDYIKGNKMHSRQEKAFLAWLNLNLQQQKFW